MPMSVVKRLEGFMRNFLWEGVEEGKKDHLVNWEVVGKNKKEGGLGVGALREKNLALCAKWLWRFPMEPSSLWARVVKSKYGVDSNGWDANPGLSTLASNPWKDISAGYPNFCQCCRFEVGKGNKVRFWEDRWLREGVLRELFPRLAALSSKQTCCVSSFVEAQVESPNWDFGFRRNLNDRETLEVIRLLDLLDGFRVSESREDKRIWDLEETGIYSCKSFQYFLNNKGIAGSFPPYEMVWKVKSPPKVKVFVWTMALGKINTSDMVQRRRPYMILSPQWCVLCRCAEENADHLFLHCSYVSKLWWRVWREAGLAWVNPKGCYQFLCSNFDAWGKGKRAAILWGCLIHSVVWNIWMERNRRIFEDFRGVSADELWDSVKFWAALWASVTQPFKDYCYSDIARNLEAAAK